ncbi:MAG: hypothetical protein JW712_09885 [Dehalococcoidales bacterium]|nr:hypothetical protein [Dehalococcoidales bacterium]
MQSTSPDGEPIAATVRLYKIISGRDYEVAYSDNGNLSVKVSPGRFKASSFAGGMLLAEEQFDISANEKKNITLSGATVYFEGFDIVPNYQKDTDILAFVQIVYSLKNVYQRVNQAEVFLQVSLDGSVIDELSLANLNPLETGRIGLNYNYIPSAGWSDGTYEFILRLNIDGKPYASSIAKKLVPGKSVISSESAPAAAVADDAESTSKDGINYVLIGGIAGGVILLIILVFVVVRLARRY